MEHASVGADAARAFTAVARTLLHQPAARRRSAFREITMRHTTVWFFPHREQMLLIYQSSLPINEDDAADVMQLMPALEIEGKSRSVAHYRQVLDQRLDKEHGALHAFREKICCRSAVSAPGWIRKRRRCKARWWKTSPPTNITNANNTANVCSAKAETSTTCFPHRQRNRCPLWRSWPSLSTAWNSALKRITVKSLMARRQTVLILTAQPRRPFRRGKLPTAARPAVSTGASTPRCV